MKCLSTFLSDFEFLDRLPWLGIPLVFSLPYKCSRSSFTAWKRALRHGGREGGGADRNKRTTRAETHRVNINSSKRSSASASLALARTPQYSISVSFPLGRTPHIACHCGRRDAGPLPLAFGPTGGSIVLPIIKHAERRTKCEREAASRAQSETQRERGG